MGRSRQYFRRRVRTLAAMIVVALGATLVAAAYDDDPQSQSGWQQGSSSNQNQDSWQQDQSSGMQESSIMQGRNLPLERQVASRLRQEGFGQEGQILVLALGNRVILLGIVPDQSQKQQIDQATNQVSGVRQVDNRLQVSRGGPVNDEQLRQRIQQQLNNQPGAQNVQVQVNNGRVTLSGQVGDWQQVADVLQAAFDAGAQNVKSQLSTSGPQQGQMGWGQQPQGQQQWGQPGGMETQRTSSSDLTLAHRIAIQLQQQLNPETPIQVMDPQAIYIHVSQGTVQLLGAVPDNSLKQQAEQIARSVRGVQNVQNQLQVAGTGGQFQTFGYVPGQQGQSQQQGQSGQQGQMGAQSRSQSSGQPSQAGQQQASASDQRLQQQVQQQLQQQLPQADINVSANQGTITLKGSVDNQSQKQQAEQIARSVRGVQDIENQINVGEFPALGYVPGQGRQPQPMEMGRQQGGASDAVLAQQIAMQLQQELSSGQIVHVMDPRAIYIHVSQGTAALYGSVQDENQKQQAEQIIRNIPGVQNVQNQLTIAGQQQVGRQAGQPQQQMSASDQRLAQQIEQRLQNQLPGANINVTVSQGTATLQGSVQDDSQKQQAEQIARSVRGVQNLRNDLSVGGEAGAHPPLGYVPGQEGQTAQEQATTGISGDTQCVQMLKQSLTDQNLQSMAQDIYVTCNKGTMAFYGYVKSDQDKDRMEKLAKSIPGIKQVDNNLIVRKGPWEQKSDSELKDDVENQFWWSPYVDSDKIHVSVQNGVVTLTGQAKDWDSMRAAVKNAFDAGAKRVKNEIQYPQAGQQVGITTNNE